MLVTPALPAPHRYGSTAVARSGRLRTVPAVRHAEADPQERARALYIDRAGEARAARQGKGRILDISA